MTRRAYRRSRRHPVLIGLAVLVVAVVFFRVLPELLLLAAVAGGGYWAGLRRRPVARASISADLDAVVAERDRLAVQVRQLTDSIAAQAPAKATVPDEAAIRAQLARRADQVSKRIGAREVRP